MRKWYESDQLAEDMETIASEEWEELKAALALKELKLQLKYIRSKTPKEKKAEVNKILGLESLKVISEINEGRIGSEAYADHLQNIWATCPGCLSDPNFPEINLKEKEEAFMNDMKYSSF